MSQETKVILITPEELLNVVRQANLPLIQRLDAIERKLAQEKVCYNVTEIAKLLTVSARTVQIWCTKGKAINGKTHVLRSHELVTGRYVIELSDVREFIMHF